MAGTSSWTNYETFFPDHGHCGDVDNETSDFFHVLIPAILGVDIVERTQLSVGKLVSTCNSSIPRWGKVGNFASIGAKLTNSI